MSSKVKQPIQDAKEFAAQVGTAADGSMIAAPPPAAVRASQNSPTPAADDTVVGAAADVPAIAVSTVAEVAEETAVYGEVTSAGRVPSLTLSPTATERQTFIMNGDEAIAYTSEQEQLNKTLRADVVRVEEEAVTKVGQFLEALHAMKKEMEQLNPRRTAALATYTKLFSWPEIPEKPMPDVKADCDLKVDLATVERLSKDLESAVSAFRASPTYLDELTKPVAALRRKNELKAGLEPTSRLLLEDDTVTEEIIIHLHEIAQGDVFGFTRAELQMKQRELDALKEDLINTSAAKHDALVTGDVRAAETLSFREIDIAEKIIERVSERVRIIFQCDTDVKEFCDKYQRTHQNADALLLDHESRMKERAAVFANDISRLMQRREEMTQQDADDEDAHAKKMEDSNVAIRAVHQQQQQNWDKIIELMEFQKVLASQRARLVEEQVALHASEVHRRAAVDSWFAGTQNMLTRLEDSQTSATTGLQWVAQLRSYVNTLCQQVEGKHIDEEGWQLRVQEQLDYLEAYKQFRGYIGDVVHRKELRVLSLQRVVRNLNLQIKEAVETLDPNAKKYEKEVQTAQTEMDSIAAQLVKLHERAAEQQKCWKVVEESLEDAQVDFVPPDIAAEKELCEKKAQALTLARQFVVAEQETVDKDTMRLRKLKTANQVAIEGVIKRRVDRSASSPSPDDSHQPHQRSSSPSISSPS